MWQIGWNETYLLNFGNRVFSYGFCYCLDCFASLMEKKTGGPLIWDQLKDAFKFLFLFPGWFLTNGFRRSFPGPQDSSGSSITAEHGMNGKTQEEERGASTVPGERAQETWWLALLSPRLHRDNHRCRSASVVTVLFGFLTQKQINIRICIYRARSVPR